MAPDHAEVEPEDVAARIEQIRALDGFAVPTDIYDEVRFIAASLGLVGSR